MGSEKQGDNRPSRAFYGKDPGLILGEAGSQRKSIRSALGIDGCLFC